MENELKEFELIGVSDIGEELGHGAHASVVKLRFRELQCAGKRFYRSLYTTGLEDEQKAVQQRWYSECSMLSALRHPNIVQFLGVYFEGGHPLPVLVMEFVPFTLSGHLERHGIFPLEISYSILVDVAKALCYLHGGNPVIIHRDLSANNVLLTSEMRAKISDLGTAKILDLTPSQKGNKSMSTCPGTLCYMPPEALTRKPAYSTEIDSFSYGVLILHIFCGQWPIPYEHNVIVDGKLIARTELERREEYLSCFGHDHPLMMCVQKCLSDIPLDRLSAIEILRCVEEVSVRHPPQYDSILALFKEINTLAERLQQANSRVSKQHREFCDQLATVSNRYDEQITEILERTEQRLSEEKRRLSTAKNELEQTLIQEREDYRSRSKSQSEEKLKLRLQLEDANFGRSINVNVLKSQASRLKADCSHLIDELSTEKAKNVVKVSELERIVAIKTKEHEQALSELQLKDEELSVKEKEIGVLKAMNKAATEELDAKSSELELKTEEERVVRKKLEAQLEAQQKLLEAMAKQLEAKAQQLKAVQSQYKQTLEQVKIIQKEFELQRRNSIAKEESLGEVITQKDCLLDDTKLEMELIRNCEIPTLRSDLELKEGIIQDLLVQQQRAQKFLSEKVCTLSDQVNVA